MVRTEAGFLYSRNPRSVAGGVVLVMVRIMKASVESAGAGQKLRGTKPGELSTSITSSPKPSTMSPRASAWRATAGST